MVTIASQKCLQSNKKRTVFVMSRVHPGETPASFVVQGLVDFLLSNHPIALLLRDHVVFKIVPMLNPDGVFLGNYRTSMLGFDLNRNWPESSQWAHPTLHAVKQLILELNEDPETDLDFVLDVHAHSSLLGSFVYGNFYEDVYRFERHTLFPKLLAQSADDFCLATSLYNRDPLKTGTARRRYSPVNVHLDIFTQLDARSAGFQVLEKLKFFASSLQDKVNCYTLEVSFYGYRPNNGASNSIIPYTEEGYMRLGRNLARALLDYYRAVNHISAPLPVGGVGARGSTPVRGAGKLARGSARGRK